MVRPEQAVHLVALQLSKLVGRKGLIMSYFFDLKSCEIVERTSGRAGSAAILQRISEYRTVDLE